MQKVFEFRWLVSEVNKNLNRNKDAVFAKPLLLRQLWLRKSNTNILYLLGAHIFIFKQKLKCMADNKNV